MSAQANPLGQLLLLAQANRQQPGGALNNQIPIPGLNNMPKLGVPAVHAGGRLQPQPPMPLPFFPSQTRGEAATAVRSNNIGSALSGF
jgi:hypothetical protein